MANSNGNSVPDASLNDARSPDPIQQLLVGWNRWEPFPKEVAVVIIRQEFEPPDEVVLDDLAKVFVRVVRKYVEDNLYIDQKEAVEVGLEYIKSQMTK